MKGLILDNGTTSNAGRYIASLRPRAAVRSLNLGPGLDT